MPVREVGWSQLLARPDVVETISLRSRFGVMAFHGGLEAGTIEIAAAAADREGASLYTVDQPADLRWHVASVLVDPDGSPPLREFLDHVDAIVAVHGYGRLTRPRDILVGGADRALAARLAEALRQRLPGLPVLDDVAAIPAGLRGWHPDNPVNRGRRGGGAQLELPVRVRRDCGPEIAASIAAVARAWARPTAATAG